VIVYRHTDPRFPFLWETAGQPPGRWVQEGGGPVNAFADTPEGAWAELLRHEEIADPDDLREVRRALWAVEIGELPAPRSRLPVVTQTGGPETYPACRREAARVRERGGRGLVARSAALMPGGAHGWRVDGGLRPGPRRDGRVVVLFGARPDLVGWQAVHLGRPAAELLTRVRPLAAT
jgi:hypothetical protein